MSRDYQHDLIYWNITSRGPEVTLAFAWMASPLGDEGWCSGCKRDALEGVVTFKAAESFNQYTDDHVLLCAQCSEAIAKACAK